MPSEPNQSLHRHARVATSGLTQLIPGLTTRQLRFLMLVFVFCGTILAVDVAAEAFAALQQPPELAVFIHIAVEVLATAFLAISAKLVLSQFATVSIAATAEHQKLVGLQGAFDELLHLKFREWHLSAAEVDVALLSIRGLSICDIANCRHTRVGTVKAQLSTIFRKVGVGSRTELLALCMDELLDYGSRNGSGAEA